MKKILLVLFALLMVLSCTAVTSFAEEVKEEPVAANIADINAKLNDVYNIEGLTVTSIVIKAGSENVAVINGAIKEENSTEVVWSNEYALTEGEYLALYHVNNSVLVYELGEDSALNADAAAILGKVIDAAQSNLDVNFDFLGLGDEGLTRNIKYMGLGMLGIFVVVGVVILLTFILNKVTGKKGA